VRREEVRRKIASFCRLVKGELREEAGEYSCHVDLEGRGSLELGLEERLDRLTVDVRSGKAIHLLDVDLEDIRQVHTYELRLPDGSGDVTWRMDTHSRSSVNLWVSKLEGKPVFAQIDVRVK